MPCSHDACKDFRDVVSAAHADHGSLNCQTPDECAKASRAKAITPAKSPETLPQDSGPPGKLCALCEKRGDICKLLLNVLLRIRKKGGNPLVRRHDPKDRRKSTDDAQRSAHLAIDINDDAPYDKLVDTALKLIDTKLISPQAFKDFISEGGCIRNYSLRAVVLDAINKSMNSEKVLSQSLPIARIEACQEGARLEFMQPHGLPTGTSITLKGTNCVPSLDGEYKLKDLKLTADDRSLLLLRQISQSGDGGQMSVQRKRHHESLGEDATGNAPADLKSLSTISRFDDIEELRLAMWDLDYYEEEILILYYEGQMTCNEIGQVLRKPPSTIRDGLKRAKEKLRRSLGGKS